MNISIPEIPPLAGNRVGIEYFSVHNLGGIVKLLLRPIVRAEHFYLEKEM